MTLPDEVRERVVSYISHQAQKDLGAIRGLIEDGRGRLLAQLDGLSEEQAAFRPGADQWSVVEVLRHVAAAERWAAGIAAGLARGRSPDDERRAGDQGTEAVASLADGRRTIEESHREMLAVVDALPAEPDAQATADHPFFGPLTCKQWLVFQRVHDLDHCGQIEQIRAAPGFPGR